jgi:hypothetical protein
MVNASAVAQAAAVRQTDELVRWRAFPHVPAAETTRLPIHGRAGASIPAG